MGRDGGLGWHTLDIETTGLDPRGDDIISIQAWALDGDAPLKYWRAWKHERGEAGIVDEFFEWSKMGSSRWHLMPVLHNAMFDLRFLFWKGKKYGHIGWDSDFIDWSNRPFVDTQSVTVILNGMELKGSGLVDWTAKQKASAPIPTLAAASRWAEVDIYVKQEAVAYRDFVNQLRAKLPGAWGCDWETPQ